MYEFAAMKKAIQTIQTSGGFGSDMEEIFWMRDTDHDG